MIAIDIKPHVGIHMGDGREVTHDQDIVAVDGREVGYLTHRPVERPNLILFAPVSEAELAVLFERCTAVRSYRPRVVNPPPDIPAELLGEDDED